VQRHRLVRRQAKPQTPTKRRQTNGRFDVDLRSRDKGKRKDAHDPEADKRSANPGINSHEADYDREQERQPDRGDENGHPKIRHWLKVCPKLAKLRPLGQANGGYESFSGNVAEAPPGLAGVGGNPRSGVFQKVCSTLRP